LCRFDTARGNVERVEFVDSPWVKDKKPKTAVADFLKTNSNFVVDHAIDERLWISVAPGGCLRRVK